MLKEELTLSEGRYELVRDNDGHSYVIPVNMVDDFYELDADVATFDPLSGDEYPDADRYRAYRVNGRLTFTDPDFE